MAVLLSILRVGAVLLLFLFNGPISGLIDRFFPSGVRPAHTPQQEARKPLARLLSVPAGMVLGIILAQLGLTKTILGMF